MSTGANWFIALPVDADSLPEGLIEGLPPGLRRLDPADLHITVAFLGAVGERRALTAWDETGSIDAGPCAAWTGAPAALGRPTRPSAYGLDMITEPGFTERFEHWRDRLRRAAGLEPEVRAFRPHVTLARPPRRASAGIRQRARRWLAAAAPASTRIQLDRIALYTAAEKPGPQHYQCVRERKLPAQDTTEQA